MANPMCIDTKHGGENAKFGIDRCLRDHRGQSGEQVRQFNRSNILIFLSLSTEL
jgi:hypothetical protein